MNSLASLAMSLAKIFSHQNAAASRLSAILDGLAANSSEKLDWRNSIVDLMKLLGMDSSLDERQNLAIALGFTGDASGSAMMNIFLNNRIILEILQNHAVEVVAILDRLVARNSERLDWRDSIVDLMKLFGLNSSLDERKKLATGLGFTGELSGSGTMNMWLHTRLIILIVDNGGSLPAKLPKESAASRVQALCRAFKTKEAIIPALAAIWDRHDTRKPSRNDFETGIYTVIDKLEPEQKKAMARAFAGYSKLRKDGTAECFFDDGLANAVKNRPFEKAEFLAALMGEGLTIAGQQLYRGSAGVPGPGQVRPWSKTQVDGPPIRAPWPWLTAIRTEASSTNEFGNLESFMPAPGTSVELQGYQFEQTCEFKPDASGGIVASCDRVHRPPDRPPPPGGLFGVPGLCEGGRNYTSGNDCLQIPMQRAGGSIRLRGFNFITPSVKVHLQSIDSPPLTPITQECVVWGDRETALNDEQGKVIADLRVRDWIEVPIPSEHPERPGAPLAPGLYEIRISVNEPAASGSPIVRTSNTLLLKIAPGDNVHFHFRSNRGRCIKETPGLGDDEIWWDAFVGHLVANKVPLDLGGPTTVQVKDIARKPIPRAPWENMDDGEPATYAFDILGPDFSFELNGVVAIAIVGFEVDSEDAARDQLQGFWEAYFEALKSIAELAVSTVGLGVALAGLIGGPIALAVAAAVAAYIAGIVLIAIGLWAVWAPADLIALDVFCLDAQSAFDSTSARKPLPSDTKRQFGGEFDDNDVLVRVTQRVLPKIPSGSEATWVQENQYDAQHDGEEFASYALEFRMTRTSI